MDKFTERAEEAIAQGVLPGCVIGTYKSGAVNVYSYGETYPLYDLASITKSIPVASLAARFIDEGKLHLDALVRDFVPELEHDFGATIEDMLRYRVRGAQMSTLDFKTFQEVRAHALERGFDGPPGESVYTNLPAFVLGIVLERVGGASLAKLGHDYFFAPLGMHETTFFPHASVCAPTEIVDGETIQGLPHDESARVFARARRTAGHAGLFSSIEDLLRFATYLIEHPTDPVVQAAEQGLGWQLNDPACMGSYHSPRTFGKTGFTGTAIIIDTTWRVALIILSNRTYPKRPADGRDIIAFRRDMADSFFTSL